VARLDQIGRELWRDRYTGETLGLEEVIERFGDELPMESRPTSKIPEWLQRLRKAIPVRLIDTERLTHALPAQSRAVRAHRYPGSPTGRTVRRYSEELGKLRHHCRVNGHWSPAGHAFVGQALAEEVTRILDGRRAKAEKSGP